MAGRAVSIAGLVGFVGLIGAHGVRLLGGTGLRPSRASRARFCSAILTLGEWLLCVLLRYQRSLLYRSPAPLSDRRWIGAFDRVRAAAHPVRYLSPPPLRHICTAVHRPMGEVYNPWCLRFKTFYYWIRPAGHVEPFQPQPVEQPQGMAVPGGANGSGKFYITHRGIKPHSATLQRGAVYLNGREIHQLPTQEVARQMAILPQQQTLPAALSVYQLVGLGRSPPPDLVAVGTGCRRPPPGGTGPVLDRS